MLTGRVFDIQPLSRLNGPGSRTVIFFKGCPLRCRWCISPEGMHPRQEVMVRPERCVYCGRCLAVCKNNALTLRNDTIVRQRSKCRGCSGLDCAGACQSEALIINSRDYSVAQLMDVIRGNRDLWDAAGGVTFSGGEPFFQYKFLEQVVRGCITELSGTAIETCAYAGTYDFLRVMQWLDFAFIDIKHIDDKKHKAATGVGNGLILHNISMLMLQEQHPRVVIRVPVISGYNDSEQTAKDIAMFMKANKLTEINLLPFDNSSEPKWLQLGLPYYYCGRPDLAASGLEKLKGVYESQGIHCYCGEMEY